jgi:hypothetical protein
MKYPFFNADNGADLTGGSAGQDNSVTPLEQTADQKQPFAIFPDEASFMSRLNREAKKQVSEFVKSLGFEQEVELKELASKHRESIEAQKSEADKLREQLAAREAQLNEINNTLKLNEIKNEIIAAGVKPERLNYALKLIDVNSVSFENGQADKTKLTDTINNLVSDFPELRAQNQAPKAGQDFGQSTTPDLLTMDIIKSMSPEETQRRLPDILKFLSK